MYITKEDSGYTSVLSGADVKKVKTLKEVKGAAKKAEEEENILAYLVETIGADKARKSLVREFKYSEFEAQSALNDYLRKSE